MKPLALVATIVLGLSAGHAVAQEKSTRSKPASRATAAARATGTTKTKSKVKAGVGQQAVIPDNIPGYKVQLIEGFTVVLSAETLKNQDNKQFERKPLDVLDFELKTITRLLPPEAVNILRQLLIWVEWDEHEAMSNGRQGSAAAVYYGGHQLHMLQEGKHPLKAQNITILSMEGLTQEHQPKHDSGRCVILHEMTHAVHDQFIGDDNLTIKAAYKQAMERKLYDPQMYASTNEHEYFAELTCAYFDQLNYYPRTRKDLEKLDPITYQLMESFWGKRQESATPVDQVTSADLKLRVEDVDLGKAVMGPTLTVKDLQGRVALVLLWHAGSTSSLACFQKLNAWNAELGDFGLSCVAVHLTGTQAEDVRKAAESRNVAFTVTEGRWTSGGLISDFKDFPRCLVFDPSGRCVFKGAPFDAETAVRAAVGAALVDGAGITEFPKGTAAQAEALRKGKSPALVLPQLLTHSRSSDDQTAAAAKKLIASLTAGGQQALEQAEPLVQTEPVAAYLKIERLPLVYKGTPLATSATKMLGKLKRDKGVVAELRARPTLVMVRAADAELSSRPGAFDPKLK
ncbi:MAG TPA: hypothetical protein VIK18_02900, partial [Pirellulales bacterium]